MYASKQCWPHELNYLTHNLEFTEVTHALKICRQLLSGDQVEVYTNQKSLKPVFVQKE